MYIPVNITVPVGAPGELLSNKIAPLLEIEVTITASEGPDVSA
jgi:hypothetical protein